MPGSLSRLGLVLLGVGLLSLAYEPFGQAYFAWVGLVPWLLALRGARSMFTTAVWGYLGGFLFFAANLWWMWTASIPGVVALVLYFALYWALAAVVLRGLGLLALEWGHAAQAAPGAGRVLATTLLLATVWVAVEWLRGHLIQGFPWMFVGHSQSPVLALCQVADLAGVFGISFWVAQINALVFLLVVRARGMHLRSDKETSPDRKRTDTSETHARRGWQLRAFAPAGAVTTGLLLAMLGYGLFRMHEDAGRPGPRIMLVQSNHLHLRGGLPTVPWEEAVDALLTATREGLGADTADLVVWPEAAIPPLNEEARQALRTTSAGRFMARTHESLATLSAEAGCSIVVGAKYVGSWQQEGTARVGRVICNSVYLYTPDGGQSADRYDKTRLASFSERVPFQGQSELLYRLMLWLSPPVATQPLTAGPADAPTVFRMTAPDDGNQPETGYRFVTPICLENIFPDYISRLVLADDGRTKRADFMVNLSNDGWFSRVERHQHLQQVILRCIENRIPQARSSNTGISALIDSCGRTLQALPALVAGTVTGDLPLDRRMTVYTRYGDVFAVFCVAITAAAVLARTVRLLHRHRRNVR